MPSGWTSQAMPDLVDTNVLVRYLTGDPPAHSEAAARVLEGERRIGIPPLVLAETAYVLKSVYGVPREDIVSTLQDLLQRVNLEVVGMETAMVLRALDRCRDSGRVSFADALLWAHARTTGEPVWTFDGNFPGEGVEARHPSHHSGLGDEQPAKA